MKKYTSEGVEENLNTTNRPCRRVVRLARASMSFGGREYALGT